MIISTSRGKIFHNSSPTWILRGFHDSLKTHLFGDFFIISWPTHQPPRHKETSQAFWRLQTGSCVLGGFVVGSVRVAEVKSEWLFVFGEKFFLREASRISRHPSTPRTKLQITLLKYLNTSQFHKIKTKNVLNMFCFANLPTYSSRLQVIFKPPPPCPRCFHGKFHREVGSTMGPLWDVPLEVLNQQNHCKVNDL